MTNVKKLTEGYCGFFKTMGSFSYLPYSKTVDLAFGGINKSGDCVSVVVGSGIALFATIILTPILLPLTAITAAIALMLVVLAALTAPFTYPVAAIMDCCNSEDSSRMVPQ